MASSQPEAGANEQSHLLLAPSHRPTGETFSHATEPANQPSHETNTRKDKQKDNSYLGSLDFERVVNEYSIQHQVKRDRTKEKLFDSRSITRWALTIACSLLSGLTTVIVVSSTEMVVAWRSSTAQSLVEQKSLPVVFAWFASVNLALADVACILCVYWVPAAVGSGIPDVKAYLNGIRIKKFNSRKLLFVKILGSVLSVSSSLAIGMEGPLILIGAIVGASLSHVGSLLSWLLSKFCGGYQSPTLARLWIWSTSDLSYFANDAERRNLVTIGAACGFAASFGSPLGGLLFVLHDISSFFEHGMFLRVLVANAIATFGLALYRRDLSSYGAIQFGTYNEANNNIFVDRFEEIPFWILMGVGGGIIGGCFGVAFRHIKIWSGRVFATPSQQLLRVSYLSLATSTIMFFLPTLEWVCHDISSMEGAETNVRQFFCKEGQVNEMAAIMFGSRNQAIVRILSTPNDFYPLTLAMVGLVFFVLMTDTNASSIPSGVFTPIVLSGASLGGAVGLLLKEYIDEGINPSTFGLLGVAALLAGVQRTTVSTCVILVEGTGQIRVLLPVIVVVVLANLVAFLISKEGIFDIILSLKRMPYLDHSDHFLEKYDIFHVRQIMNEPVITVRERERVGKLVKLLQTSGHNGFPVVDKQGRFKGLVRRKQIVALLECGIFEKAGADEDIDDTNSLASSNVSGSKPGGRMALTALMHWAFHIKDDRYSGDFPITDLQYDDYDDNTFLLNTEKSLKQVIEGRKTATPSIAATIPTVEAIGSYDAATKRASNIQGQSFFNAQTIKRMEVADREFALGGDETMPPINATSFAGDIDSGILLEDEEDKSRSSRFVSPASDASYLDESPLTSSVQSAPTGFAKLGQDRDGNVVIAWLDPAHLHDVVNLGAVMNLGTFCVPEHCPVSKAYKLFTNLGLRWIVVIGGSSGGEVVGVLNRSNLLESHIRMKVDR